MLLPEIISAVRIELQDTSETLYTEEELIRAIEKSISLMSRLLPKRSFIEGEIESDMIISDRVLDITNILSDYIRIEKVEYPADEEPPQFLTADVISNHLMFRTIPSLTTGDTIRIIYFDKWTPPTSTTPGNYPSHLNDAVIIGSVGQALIFKAEKYTQEAVSIIVEDEAGVSADFATYMGYAKDALDAANAAFDASLASLSSITTPLNTDAHAALDCAEVAFLAGAQFLVDGTPHINTATRGDSVGQVYGQYGGVAVGIGNGRVSAASQWIATAQAFLDESTRESAAGNGYVMEAVQRLAMVDKLLERVGDAEKTSAQLLDIAGRYLASGQAKINEMLAALGLKAEMQLNRAEAAQHS